MSSIGKLAAVAEMKSYGNSSTRKQLLIGQSHVHFGNSLIWVDLDAELDFVKVQSDLKDTMQISSVAEQAHLEGRPRLKQLFADLAQQLAQGKALNVEGLIDLLTLKKSNEEARADAAIALDRLVKDVVSHFPVRPDDD